MSGVSAPRKEPCPPSGTRGHESEALWSRGPAPGAVGRKILPNAGPRASAPAQSGRGRREKPRALQPHGPPGPQHRHFRVRGGGGAVRSLGQLLTVPRKPLSGTQIASTSHPPRPLSAGGPPGVRFGRRTALGGAPSCVSPLVWCRGPRVSSHLPNRSPWSGPGIHTRARSLAALRQIGRRSAVHASLSHRDSGSSTFPSVCGAAG